MKLVSLNWHPGDRQLRQFALLGGVLAPLLTWWWGGSSLGVAVALGLGLLLALVGWWHPRTVRPLFLLLTLVALPIGLVVGELALIVIYFGMLLPLGLCFRLWKRDALQLRVDSQAKTYWQTKTRVPHVSRYYRQF